MLYLLLKVTRGRLPEEQGNPFPFSPPSWRVTPLLPAGLSARSPKHTHRQAVWQRNICQKVIFNECLYDSASQLLFRQADRTMLDESADHLFLQAKAPPVLFRRILRRILDKLGENGLTEIDAERVAECQQVTGDVGDLIRDLAHFGRVLDNLS
jgi:hypothetical protein